MAGMVTMSEPRTGLAARDHMPITGRIASRLHHRYGWVDMDDLRSYAYLGLTLAAKRYRADRGVAFEMFASRKGMFLAIDEMRKDGVLRRRRAGPGLTTTVLTADIPDPRGSRSYERLERRDMCRMLLGRLRTQDRQLVMMYYADGMTFREIAKVFSISESAACLRHKAALGTLRRIARKTVIA